MIRYQSNAYKENPLGVPYPWYTSKEDGWVLNVPMTTFNWPSDYVDPCLDETNYNCHGTEAYMRLEDYKWIPTRNSYSALWVCKARVDPDLLNTVAPGQPTTQSCDVKASQQCVLELSNQYAAGPPSGTDACQVLQTTIDDVVNCHNQHGCEDLGKEVCRGMIDQLNVLSCTDLTCEASRGLSPGAIAGIVIGILIVLSLVGTMVYCKCKKQQKEVPNSAAHHGQSVPTIPPRPSLPSNDSVTETQVTQV